MIGADPACRTGCPTTGDSVEVSQAAKVPEPTTRWVKLRVVRTTLDGLAKTMADEGIRPPAVWVVGDVVGLGPGARHVPAGTSDDAEDED